MPVCPNCYTEVNPGANICPKCGMNLVQLTAVATPSRPKSQRQNLAVTAVGLAILVGFTIGAELGYIGLAVAGLIPAIACILLYEWERRRGLRPGVRFGAISVLLVIIGVGLGAILPVAVIIAYFLWVRYRLKVKTAQSATIGTAQV